MNKNTKRRLHVRLLELSNDRFAELRKELEKENPNYDYFFEMLHSTINTMMVVLTEVSYEQGFWKAMSKDLKAKALREKSIRD